MFKNKLAEFVYLRTYARWKEEDSRRETWNESVGRVVDFLTTNLESKLDSKLLTPIALAIHNMDIMPSMRLMQFAGPAAQDNNILLYNCSYIAPTKLKDFADILYVLMCGVGVGFSVEAHNIEKLPRIKFQKKPEGTDTFIIEDSRQGWAEALEYGLNTWYAGYDCTFDYRQVRPAGTRLQTTGGRSSGPEPLRQALNFIRQLVLQRQGKRLKPIHVHDIICKIGECVVAGGVRRSALISLSDLDDIDLRDAKKGQFYLTHPYRSMSNNSTVYNEKPSDLEFLKEWTAIVESGTGERGIFNRSVDAMKKQLPKRRQKVLGKRIRTVGTNPCGEILLQSHQFCNLTEVVVKPEDTEKTLLRKVMLATILGTIQSSFTNFPFIQDKWKQNCEEERLLGVSLTGIYDNDLLKEEYHLFVAVTENGKVVRDPSVNMDNWEGNFRLSSRRTRLLKKLKKAARRINRVYSNALGINQSTCVTCIKPSGTVSQVVDCASGIHPRFAKFYIRRVRVNVHDPIFHLIKDQGLPYFPEVGQTEENMTTAVIEFVVKSPEGALTKNELTADTHFHDWLVYKEHYTEHNPSVTIQVDKHEWLDMGHTIHTYFNSIGGISVLPKFDHAYQLAPYEEITEEEYNKRVVVLDKLDFSKLSNYEKEDTTDVKRELACAGGQCEL